MDKRIGDQKDEEAGVKTIGVKDVRAHGRCGCSLPLAVTRRTRETWEQERTETVASRMRRVTPAVDARFPPPTHQPSRHTPNRQSRLLIHWLRTQPLTFSRPFHAAPVLPLPSSVLLSPLRSGQHRPVRDPQTHTRSNFAPQGRL